MKMPVAAFQLFAVITTSIITTRLPKSRLFAMAIIYVLNIGGILTIMLIPQKHKLARLAGFWVVSTAAPAFPLMLSLFASNTAGFTKKSLTSTFIFVGYCVGNLLGPQFFISTEAPHYGVSFRLFFPFRNPNPSNTRIGCRLLTKPCSHAPRSRLS